ncbi:MAG: glycosyltransferase [Candidatus Acidiferrales bacterium]
MIPGLKGKSIVLATIGSLGDLHPCLAIALELARRGHHITIASTECYRAKVEALGITFHPIRPNWNPTDPEIIRQCENLRRGPEVLFRDLLLPELRGTYDDLLSAATGADLMIAGELVYAAPLVAEKLNLRWVSIILSPFSFFSSHDPSLIPTAPGLFQLRRLGWPAYWLGLNIGRLATRHWSNPVRRFRREMALRPECDPVFRDKFSPDLVLALFSRYFAEAQPDWPPHTVQPGYVFYDRQSSDTGAHLTRVLRQGTASAVPKNAPYTGVSTPEVEPESARRIVELSSDHSPALETFLAAGDPPIVFTLGSTVVHNPGNFYAASLEAAKMLHRRAILVDANAAPGLNSPQVLVLPYAPFSQLFPHAAAIVHQGGSGTTGQALRAGRPELIVPYGWDQPDNAARVQRLGAGISIGRRTYSASTAAAALKRLLEDSRFATHATEIAARIQQEDASTRACDAVGSVLATTSAATSSTPP